MDWLGLREPRKGRPCDLGFRTVLLCSRGESRLEAAVVIQARGRGGCPRTVAGLRQGPRR